MSCRAGAAATRQQAAGAPMMFWRPMGFWKKMTEATMTMTRLRQLPMLCVTGDTRCRIMYDTWTPPPHAPISQ